LDLSLSLEPYDTLVVHLIEDERETTVTVHPARAGATSLLRALDESIAAGYGECFWPGAPGGQYWWIFKREAELVEVIAMWTRGGAAMWEHVFRASESAAWLEGRLTSEIDRLELRSES